MNRMIGCYAVALAVLFPSSSASAQTDADRIRARVKDGQRVSITDNQGQEFKGSIHTVATDGLNMLVNGKSVDLPYDTIIRIDRPNDGLANGALIGLGVGTAVGLIAWAVDPCESFCVGGTGAAVGSTLIMGGLGAAVGVGIDALRHHEREIYKRGSSVHATIAPAIGRRGGGGVVSMTW